MLPTFDRSRLIVKPLAERQHDLSIAAQLPLEELPPPLDSRAMASIAELGRRMAAARERGAAILLLMGGHVIRAGVARQLIDLMERGLLTHIGMNGAGPIHDYELARIGATCESVARYIRSGEFGLWRETGEINDIVRAGVAGGLGLAESIGRHILESDYPHRNLSVLAAAVRLDVPVTCHIGLVELLEPVDHVILDEPDPRRHRQVATPRPVDVPPFVPLQEHDDFVGLDRVSREGRLAAVGNHCDVEPVADLHAVAALVHLGHDKRAVLPVVLRPVALFPSFDDDVGQVPRGRQVGIGHGRRAGPGGQEEDDGHKA